jgi:hypothetical protein
VETALRDQIEELGNKLRKGQWKGKIL